MVVKGAVVDLGNLRCLGAIRNTTTSMVVEGAVVDLGNLRCLSAIRNYQL